MLNLKSSQRMAAAHRAPPPNWRVLATQLGAQFLSTQSAHHDPDQFVADNLTLLKQSGLFAVGVPIALGGAGAQYRELCAVLAKLAEYCSSTALAFSMHTHQVMLAAWRWKHQNAPVASLLERVATENLHLLSSGGSDGLNSSGAAARVAGGYCINACKPFASGAPTGDLLMTSAVYEDPEKGKTVLHFPVPMNAEGVTIDPVWRAMGMRGTGSHNIVLSDVFIPERDIAIQRPQGVWHPIIHANVMIAFPIIYSVYVGIAEAARNLTVQHLRHWLGTASKPYDHTAYLIGGLENELTAARLAHEHMMAIATSSQPSLETTHHILAGRTLVAQAVLNVVDLAMEAIGGRAFYCDLGLEQLFRDAQAARYHPFPEGKQRQLLGYQVLGWEASSGF